MFIMSRKKTNVMLSPLEECCYSTFQVKLFNRIREYIYNTLVVDSVNEVIPEYIKPERRLIYDFPGVYDEYIISLRPESIYIRCVDKCAVSTKGMWKWELYLFIKECGEDFNRSFFGINHRYMLRKNECKEEANMLLLYAIEDNDQFVTPSMVDEIFDD